MQLRSVALMTVLARSILVASLATEAQQATTVSRIGWLHPGLSRLEPHLSLEAFRQGLRAFGSVEGQHNPRRYVQL